MADIILIQETRIQAGKVNPSTDAVLEKDFIIDPSEVKKFKDYNEGFCGRYKIPVGAADMPLSLGTVAEAKVLIFRPGEDIEMKIINTNGTSQKFLFLGGRTSILHIEFTGLLVSNSSVEDIKGIYYVAGD